jgi:chromosome segregation ATPase
MTIGLGERKEEIKNYAADADLAKKEASEALKRLERIVTGDPSDMARYNEMVAGKSLDEIDHEIGAEKAKLELIHGVDPSVLRQFQKRAKEIQEMTKRKEEMTAKLESLADQIKQLMERWEPELDALIAKINTAFGHNFDLIGCAGEVGVNKHEDFEQWCIEIKVKFRYVSLTTSSRLPANIFQVRTRHLYS